MNDLDKLFEEEAAARKAAAEALDNDLAYQARLKAKQAAERAREAAQGIDWNNLPAEADEPAEDDDGEEDGES